MYIWDSAVLQVSPGQRRSTERLAVEVLAAIFPAVRLQPGGGHEVADAGLARPTETSRATTTAKTPSVRLMPAQS